MTEDRSPEALMERGLELSAASVRDVWPDLANDVATFLPLAVARTRLEDEAGLRQMGAALREAGEAIIASQQPPPAGTLRKWDRAEQAAEHEADCRARMMAAWRKLAGLPPAE